MDRNQQPRLFLAILAGGASLRAHRGDGSAPKQFREVAGLMLFMHGLRELAQAPGLAHVVLVVPEAWRPLVEQTLVAAGLPLAFTLAPAGVHRTASAWHALQHLASLPGLQIPAAGDLVAIHDAARPFASRYLLARLARAAARHGAAIPAVPVSDTIVQLAPGEVVSAVAGQGAEMPAGQAAAALDPEPEAEQRTVATYLERQRLVAVQTPQVARWRELYDAHAWAAATGASFTDDGGLLAERGLCPTVVMGEVGNWKITSDEDWRRAEAVLLRASTV